MKKVKVSFLAIGTVALTIGFCSFTNIEKEEEEKPLTLKYAVYSTSPTGMNPQRNSANYSIETDEPDDCGTPTTLCWFRFNDVNDNGIIDISEFNTIFAAYGDGSTDTSLDDDAEVSGLYQKRS